MPAFLEARVADVNLSSSGYFKALTCCLVAVHGRVVVGGVGWCQKNGLGQCISWEGLMAKEFKGFLGGKARHGREGMPIKGKQKEFGKSAGGAGWGSPVDKSKPVFNTPDLTSRSRWSNDPPLGGKSGGSKSEKYNPDAPKGKSMGEVRDRGGKYDPNNPGGKGGASGGGSDKKGGGIGSDFMRGLDRFGKWGKHHPDRSVVVSQRPATMMYSRTIGPGGIRLG
jgi:hypothetical protein